MFNLIGLELYMRINPDISFMLVSYVLLVSFMSFMFVVGEGFYSFDSMLVVGDFLLLVVGEGFTLLVGEGLLLF